MNTRSFHVVPGSVAADILADSRHLILEIVRNIYLGHERGVTINPASYFLRFPGQPSDRVIALPGYLGDPVDRIGLKWIASVPENLARGLPRASAVLVLNDRRTGFPLACLEASGISAARTAASAALAATALTAPLGARRLAFVGAGVIARAIADYLESSGYTVSEVCCHDLDAERAERLAAYASVRFGVPACSANLDKALDCDTVVFATTAATPYVAADLPLRPGQLLMNISLRDLAPQILLRAANVLDDVDHCLTAHTSPHLAEQLSGSRAFVTGTLGGVLAGAVPADPARATVFSPFGLGVLDIGVGAFVLAEAQRRGTALEIPQFFDMGEG
jgi:N-[(2S)-2-amino-2-carboxyethyl]-L-glutamate dehydrogenase